MEYSNVQTGLALGNNQEGDLDLNLSNVDANSQDCPLVDPDLHTPMEILNFRFWVHEFLLTKFERIAELIRQARSAQGEVAIGPEHRTIVCIQSPGEVKYIDFQRTFQVIYSSTGFVFNPVPPAFDVDTLVSTLRVATLFQNLGLRNFAISQLESQKAYTSAIRRIALSDELELPDWEVPAFAELCRHPEPISAEEAAILGIARFTEIARIREVEQRRQYMELIDKVATGPLLATDGTVMKDKLQTAAEETLKLSPSLVCKCGVQKPSAPRPSLFSARPPLAPPAPPAPQTGFYFGAPLARPPSPFAPSASISPPTVISPPTAASEPTPAVTCQIHQLAPSIASESRTLYNHLSSTLERIEVLKQDDSAIMQRLQGVDKECSIENELREANWVRKAV